MDHRYRKYLKNGDEPLRIRGIMLEISKNIIWVHGPKVWLVLSYYHCNQSGICNVEILQVRVVCF